MTKDEFMTEFMDGFDEGLKAECAKLESNESWQEFLAELDREFMYAKGPKLPELDIKAMYKTPGR